MEFSRISFKNQRYLTKKEKLKLCNFIECKLYKSYVYILAHCAINLTWKLSKIVYTTQIMLIWKKKIKIMLKLKMSILLMFKYLI